MPSRREYRAAEERIKESVALRRAGFPNHTYPTRRQDLETMLEYHDEHGMPQATLWGRLWAWFTRGEG